MRLSSFVATLACVAGVASAAAARSPPGTVIQARQDNGQQNAEQNAQGNNQNVSLLPVIVVKSELTLV